MTIKLDGDAGVTTPAIIYSAAEEEAILAPTGTTAERPSSPVNGMLRYNTTTSKMENYVAGAWADVGSGSGGGSVKQIKYLYPDPDVVALNVTGWTEVSSTLRISITPTASDTILMVSYHFLYNSKGSTNLAHFKLYDYTNSSDPILTHGNNSGSRTVTNASQRNASGDLNNANMTEMRVFISSASTSARTYSLYHKSEDPATEKIFFGGGTTSNANIEITRPSAIVMEMDAS